MKVFSTPQIREIDRYTIQHEPIESVDLMERAAYALFSWVVSNISFYNKVLVLCGPGNNGGDGLALARMMYCVGYNIEVYCLQANSYSSDFSLNLDRLKKINVLLKPICTSTDFPKINSDDVIVDALFGSGLTRPLEGVSAELVNYVNSVSSKIISIDIPSGLFGDTNPYPNISPIIESDICLTLQFPKKSFFFAENEKYLNKWIVLPIGLHHQIIDETQTPFFYTDFSEVKPRFLPRKTFSHKGTYGHTLIVAGSYGMMGAASLCALSAVKSGVGLVTMHIPQCGYSIAQQLVPMAMCVVDKNDNCISDVCIPDNKYSSICIGPGFGTSQETVNALHNLLSSINVPLLLDADALNIISQNMHLLNILPENTIITPHPGEFDRLFGKCSCGQERLDRAIEIAHRYKIVIVLKGAYTQVISPDGSVQFNSTGNPGLATGGSGDVLSGLISGLLAQGHSSVNAAVIGVFLHGLSGDIAEKELGQHSLSAENIIESLPLAFKYLLE
ncbi:MAG: NAD(P)H-hydrate dehydratase [Bacteroidales bacterium]